MGWRPEGDKIEVTEADQFSGLRPLERSGQVKGEGIEREVAAHPNARHHETTDPTGTEAIE